MWRACYMNIPCEGIKTWSEYEEMENRLIQVSGFDMEKLIELFAAGYTLKPPKQPESLEVMAMEMNL